MRLVDHRDNSTHSAEEADVVVDLVRDLLGRTWHDPSERDGDGRPVGPRPLAAADVIVITPYNAQVGLLRRLLDDAGLVDVPVGTVDKFQGQEAAVAVLSMAASSHSDVSRGMGFLLDRHRLNVAISRGAALGLRRPLGGPHRLLAPQPRPSSWPSGRSSAWATPHARRTDRATAPPVRASA